MKNIKKAVIAVVAAMPLMLPLSGIARAAQNNLDCGDVEGGDCNLQIQTSPLYCTDPSVEVFNPTTDGCDLAIDKQVSINNGPYAEADTSADAAQAQVGDTVTWQITVSNDSDGLVPTGDLTVGDVLPAGVAYDSYTASTGSYASGVWSFDLTGNLPATLTITSHSTETGLFENTAAFATYDPCLDGCSGAGIYSDANPDNNSNDAWIDPSGQPVVLAENTLVNTGSGVALQTIAAGTLIAAAGATLLIGRRRGYKAED